MGGQITRVAIGNRRDAAVRLIRAVRELNLEHEYGMRTTAFHTEDERYAMFVREAGQRGRRGVGRLGVRCRG